MVLATHAVVGGALGRFLPPPLSFLVGFLSHFLFDAIPHWDYPLGSRKVDPTNKLNTDLTIGRAFVFDLTKIALDLAIGFSLVFFFHLAFWAAVGAVLPDFLQFAYFKLRWPALRRLQRFHVWIHATKRLDERMILGPTLQILLIVAVLVIIRL